MSKTDSNPHPIQWTAPQIFSGADLKSALWKKKEVTCLRRIVEAWISPTSKTLQNLPLDLPSPQLKSALILTVDSAWVQ